MTSLSRRLAALEEKHRPSKTDPEVWSAHYRQEQRNNTRTRAWLEVVAEAVSEGRTVPQRTEPKRDADELADLALLTRAGFYPPPKMTETQARAARRKLFMLFMRTAGVPQEQLEQDLQRLESEA